VPPAGKSKVIVGHYLQVSIGIALDALRISSLRVTVVSHKKVGVSQVE